MELASDPLPLARRGGGGLLSPKSTLDLHGCRGQLADLVGGEEGNGAVRGSAARELTQARRHRLNAPCRVVTDEPSDGRGKANQSRRREQVPGKCRV